MSEQEIWRSAEELALLAEVAECARAEAAAAARKIALTEKYHELRYRGAVLSADFSSDMAARSALAEIALEVTTSYSVVSGWLDLSLSLERVPEVADAFAEGRIPVANIRAIIDRIAGAKQAILRQIESNVVAAATRLASRALGAEIDRLLIEADSEWAARERERAEATRAVTSRRLPRGMAQLKATLTAMECTEIDELINEVAKTVCYRDPRDPKQRRLDAYLALLRGQTALECGCDDADCERRATTPEPATRPVVRLNIMCSLEALLGIGDNPAYLAGYGILDADKARAIAQDATWQALIAAATELANRVPPREPDFPIGGPLDPRSERWRPRCHDIGLGGEAGIVVGYSPALPAGEVLPRGGHGIARRRILDSHKTLVKLTRQIESEPDRCHAEFPDGHGGFDNPPPRALTYRPADDLVTAVRLRDGTCRHPGCTTPADKCQIDHIVPFQHEDPPDGGWTILANLQCLCVNHHQLKTAKLWHYEMLPNAIIHAANRIGQHGLSLPAYRSS